ALAGMTAFAVDNKGQRSGAAAMSENAGSLAVKLQPLGKVEFAAKDSVSVYDFRQSMLKKLQLEREAALNKAREECVARTKTREEESAAHPAPANTIIVVGAGDFSAEDGEKVSVVTTKVGAVGKAISRWDTTGHGIE